MTSMLAVLFCAAPAAPLAASDDLLTKVEKQVAKDLERAAVVFHDLRQMITTTAPVMEFAGHLSVVHVSTSDNTSVRVVTLRPFQAALPTMQRRSWTSDGVSIIGEMSDSGAIALGRDCRLSVTPELTQRAAARTLQAIANNQSSLCIGVSYERTSSAEVVFTDGPWAPFGHKRERSLSFSYGEWQVVADVGRETARQIASQWGNADTRAVLRYYDDIDLISERLTILIKAMIRHQLERTDQWPAIITHHETSPTWNNDVGRRITAASLEYLAATSSSNLSPDLFQSPYRPATDPWPPLRTHPDDIAAAPYLEWSAWLCFDWSVPANASHNRAVLSHRQPLFNPQTGKAQFVVAFANGRTRVLNAEPIVDDGIHSTPWSVLSPHFDGDDLFAPDGERGDIFQPGQGDSERAFLR